MNSIFILFLKILFASLSLPIFLISFSLLSSSSSPSLSMSLCVSITWNANVICVQAHESKKTTVGDCEYNGLRHRKTFACAAKKWKILQMALIAGPNRDSWLSQEKGVPICHREQLAKQLGRKTERVEFFLLLSFKLKLEFFAVSDEKNSIDADVEIEIVDPRWRLRPTQTCGAASRMTLNQLTGLDPS